MPEFSHQRPTYKTQTAKGTLYAYSRVNGRKVALGRAGTPAALAKLSRLQAEWDATRHEFERADATRLTVAEVAERFIQYESDRAVGSRGHPPTCCEISVGECLQSLPAGSVLHPAPQFACRW